MNDIVPKVETVVAEMPEKSMGQMLIEMAKDEKLNEAKLEALISMKNDEEDREAKRAFNAALVAFKKDPPRIIKNMSVSFGKTSYKHSSLDSALRQIDPELHKYGLAFTWRLKVTKTDVEVIGVLRHEKGYSEENIWVDDPDTSGQKNKAQAKGSAVTYGKRYTLLAALGLAEQGEDDDGLKAHMAKAVDEDMLLELQDLIEKSGSEAQALCKHFKVGSLAQLSNQQYGAAKAMLNAKIRKGNAQ